MCVGLFLLSFSDLLRRNSHGVTCETLMKMIGRYEHDVTIQQVLSSPEPSRNSRCACGISVLFANVMCNGGVAGHVCLHGSKKIFWEVVVIEQSIDVCC